MWRIAAYIRFGRHVGVYLFEPLYGNETFMILIIIP